MSTLKSAAVGHTNRFVPASRGHGETAISSTERQDIVNQGNASRAASADALSFVSTSTLNAGHDGGIIAQRTVQTTTTRTETLGIAKPLDISAFTKKSSRKLITSGEKAAHSGPTIEEIPDDTNSTSFPRTANGSSAPFIDASQAPSDSSQMPSFRPAIQPVFAFAHSNNQKEPKASIPSQPLQPFAWAQPDKTARTGALDNNTPARRLESQGPAEVIPNIDLLQLGNSSYLHGHVLNADDSAGQEGSKKRRRTKDMHLVGQASNAPSLSHLDLQLPFDESGITMVGDEEDHDGDPRSFKRSKTENHNQDANFRSPTTFSRMSQQSPQASLPAASPNYNQYTNEQVYANVETQLPYDPYDALSYMMEHADKLQAARQRWNDCTMNEWIQGAKELTGEFDRLLDYVKEHMKRKIDLFASLHQTITDHSSLLDKREEKLRTVQGKLAKDAGNIVFGVGNEKSA